jgi:hypothetical protein
MRQFSGASLRRTLDWSVEMMRTFLRAMLHPER